MGGWGVRNGTDLGAERASERVRSVERRVGSGGGRRVRMLNYLKDPKVDRCKLCSCVGSWGGCCKVFCCMLMLLSNA